MACGVGVGPVGCPCWGSVVVTYFLGSVLHLRGPTSPQCGQLFLVLNVFGVGFVGLLSHKRKVEQNRFNIIYSKILLYQVSDNMCRYLIEFFLLLGGFDACV